jgi:hypothetical protein
LLTEYTVPGTDDAKDWSEVMEAMDIMELNQVLDTEVMEAMDIMELNQVLDTEVSKALEVVNIYYAYKSGCR